MRQDRLRQRHVSPPPVLQRGKGDLGHSPDSLQGGLQKHLLRCVPSLLSAALLGQDQELVAQKQAVQQEQNDHTGYQQKDHQSQICHGVAFGQICWCGLTYLRHFIPEDMEGEF